jgi:hypothetical protein
VSLYWQVQARVAVPPFAALFHSRVPCVQSDGTDSIELVPDAAQTAWAGAAVAIGNAWISENCTGALREANGALDAAYTFDQPLLFKPTLADVRRRRTQSPGSRLCHRQGPVGPLAARASTDTGAAALRNARDHSVWVLYGYHFTGPLRTSLYQCRVLSARYSTTYSSPYN